ncbi:MAG TPA: condensation domain-containing protein, partial [Longimicrobiaceae bacterium]|nr:condensation domain-containing protein [Longimicrobiaceae bacterium]
MSTDLMKRLAELSPEKRRMLEMRLRTARAATAEIQPLPRGADGAAGLPLSFAQERLWFLEQLDPGSPVYNVPSAFSLEGPLDVDALGRALAEVVRRHEVLRAAFEPTEAGPVQRILPPDAFRMEVVDLTHLPEADRDDEADRRMGEEGRRPFDLRRGPLIRATLYRIHPAEHGLVIVQHPAATDAWAGKLLVEEMTALYEAFLAGKPSPLPPLALQYADYAAW